MGQGQSGQAIKLFQAIWKISFTFHLWHRSFIVDDVKLAKLSDNSFAQKNVAFWRLKNSEASYIYSEVQDPQPSGSTSLVEIHVDSRQRQPDFTYDAALSIAQMVSLYDRREQLNRHFFKPILSQSSCIFSLLPPPRDLNVTSRLRPASTYPRPTTRTKRYTSFVQHGLLHYQTE